jgi:hypothetical protein
LQRVAGGVVLDEGVVAARVLELARLVEGGEIAVLNGRAGGEGELGDVAGGVVLVALNPGYRNPRPAAPATTDSLRQVLPDFYLSRPLINWRAQQ